MGGALWQRCDKWAESVFVRGGFEFLCKFGALRRVIPDRSDRPKGVESHTFLLPISVIPRQKDRGKGKEVKRV